MKIQGRSNLFLILGAALLAACARPSESSEDEAMFLAAGQSYLEGATIAKPAAQRELKLVMHEVNSALWDALVPEQAGAMREVAATSCKPDFKILLIGAAIEFSPTNGCKLSGTIGLKFFPTTAVVDLDVVGLTHIEKIQFDAEVVLSQGMQVKLDMTVLNGVISLRALKLAAIESVTANGRVALAIGGGMFKIDSRVNAFLSNNGLGVALMTKIDKSIGASNIQACILSGGVANDPTAGSTGTCMRLGGG